MLHYFITEFCIKNEVWAAFIYQQREINDGLRLMKQRLRDSIIVLCEMIGIPVGRLVLSEKGQR